MRRPFNLQRGGPGLGAGGGGVTRRRIQEHQASAEAALPVSRAIDAVLWPIWPVLYIAGCWAVLLRPAVAKVVPVIPYVLPGRKARTGEEGGGDTDTLILQVTAGTRACR